MELKIERNAYSKETEKTLIDEFEKRVNANPPYTCPIEVNLSYLKFCHAQSCGKCTPCSDGLRVVIALHEQILNGDANANTINLIKKSLQSISVSADCVIGKDAAKIALEFLENNIKDYEYHVKNNDCIFGFEQPIPCISLCPAHVDVPGYIALVNAKKYDDAIRLIRKDNPFPTACGLICEHPCENRCRRKMLDQAINIRGIKRYAVDMIHANKVPSPMIAPFTNKNIAIIGAGPSGLTCAYFLRLMGHNVTVYEEKNHLGGMMRYGIPSYRFPRERLDEDINVILQTGVTVINKKVGTEITIEELKNNFDAIYIAIGAHTDKKLKLDGQNANGVIPAVEMLKNIGDEIYPDYTNKDVIVVGGGNVAMDCARTALRCKAKSVRIVYRRKIEDMTALPEEISSAIEEGVKIETLKSPNKIISDSNGNVIALETKQQMCSLIDKNGRVGVKDKTNADFVTYNANIIIMATGQDIDSSYFEKEGIKCNKGAFETDDYTKVIGQEKIFAGGDCVFGPATVIKAIQAGKVAAKTIDKYLGFNHEIKIDIKIPEAIIKDDVRCGRIDMVEKEADVRNKTFDQSEILMSEEEMLQETSRCLRCDYKGCSLLNGGRKLSW